jgi:hypothetical protein
MPAIVASCKVGATCASPCTARTACRIACALSSEPITAIPSAAPTWRTVVLVPLATPALSGSISERMTLTSCELAKPTPMPNNTEPGSSATSVVSVEIIAAVTANPTASSTRPTRTTRTVPITRVSRPPIGAPNAIATPIGTM